MKKILYIIVASAVVFAACSKSDDEPGGGGGPSISVITPGNKPLVLAYEPGAATTFTVNATSSWSVSGQADWFTVEPSSGGAGQTPVTITITKENDTHRDRYQTINIGGESLTVTQKYKGALTLTDRKKYVNCDGGYVEVDLQHNVEHSIRIPLNQRDWIHEEQPKSLETTTLRFRVDPITNGYAGRNGMVVISDKADANLTDTVFIYQSQRDVILLDGREKPVSAEGGTFTIELRHNIGSGNYAVKMPDDEWLHNITPDVKSSSLTTDFFNFLVDENPDGVDKENRTAKVVFVNEDMDLSDTLFVTQRVKDGMIWSQTSYEVGYGDKDFTVSFDANTDNLEYKITQGDSWIFEKPGAVAGIQSLVATKQFVFKVATNFSKEERVGEVKFFVKGKESEAQAVKITQSGNPESLTMSGDRAMVAVYNGLNTGQNKGNRAVLVSWRYLPTDPSNIAFDLWRSENGADAVKVNAEPISKGTNFQDKTANRSVDNTYYLRLAGNTDNLGEFTFTSQAASKSYFSIPIDDSDLPYPGLNYMVRDAAVGDLDGDGNLDVVIRRDVQPYDIGDMSSGVWKGPQAGSTLLQAYKMDGTYLWTVDLGPNINQGEHTAPFIVYDLDGDGRAEVAVRTSELTRFADGFQIPGTTHASSDGRVCAGPEYLSIINGTTGAEVARTNYIPRGVPGEFGSFSNGNPDGINRPNRYLMGVGHFGGITPSVIICRGYYAKTVIEAWDFSGGTLTKRWNFTAVPGGENSDYAGQGNHSIAVGDVDGDGYDEIVYGAMTVDHDGRGLYSSKLGHGDALHFGKFDPDRSGLQIYSCFESGRTAVALRNASNGSVIWKVDMPSNGDIGRCLIANIDPAKRGAESWHSGNGSSTYDIKGNLTGKSLPTTAGGGVTYNHAIWWTGSLNRQLLDKNTITSYTDGRIFTGGYDNLSVSTTNKEGLPFFGDIFGDWREEMIHVHNDGERPKELRVFTTDYPCDYKFHYLMSNRHYRLSAAHQNIGYNQPTHLDYYIGPDMFD